MKFNQATKFLRHGDTFIPVPGGVEEPASCLPPDVYTIVVTDEQGAMFKRLERFQLPGRVYGDVQTRARRIMNTYQDRGENTGILASGIQGSGKTLLAKVLSEMAITEYQMPTITINRPLCGEDFNIFLSKVMQPAIVIFDEFEKVYDDEDQRKLLTLLDGVYASNKLFIFLVNDEKKLDKHMIGRPGRILYQFNYASLSPAFIKEYAEEKLVNKEHLMSLLVFCCMQNAVTYDQISNLIAEMNRYDEPAYKASKWLNLSLTEGETKFYLRPIVNDKPMYFNSNDSKGETIRTLPSEPGATNSVTFAALDPDDRDGKRHIKLLMDVHGATEADIIIQGDDYGRAGLAVRYGFDGLESFDFEKGTLVFKTDNPSVKIVASKDAAGLFGKLSRFVELSGRGGEFSFTSIALFPELSARPNDSGKDNPMAERDIDNPPFKY